jgi:hypothetical protein
LVVFLAIAPAHGEGDLFAGNERASLRVRIELAGSGRTSLPNGVEWAALSASRTLDLTYDLVDVGNDGVPIVGGVPDGTIPSAVRDLEAGMAACRDDQVCMAAKMLEFARSGQGGQNPFLAGTGMQPGRYRNFAADRAGVCAKGMVRVDDVLSGVTIPPPNPAVAYRFTRVGDQILPQDDFAITDAVCTVEVSLDTQTGALSLRLPVGKFRVPVSMGPGAFTNERSVAFVEGRDTFELLDQPSARDDAWSGSAAIEKVGSASHNSGQVVVGLSGRISWRLIGG